MRLTVVINLPIVLLVLATGLAALPTINTNGKDPMIQGPLHFLFHCTFFLLNSSIGPGGETVR